MNEDFKLCRYPEGEDGCRLQANYMITWEPVRVDANDEEIDEERTIAEVNEAVWRGLIDHDRIPVCAKHRDSAVEDLRALRFPTDAQIDLITISQIVSYSVVRREKITNVEVAGPDEYIEENVGVQETPTEEARWGYKADGTPRKRPGRKAAATNH